MTATSSPVGPTPGGSDRRRYLVGSTDPTLLSRVGAALAADPGVVVIRVLPGDGGLVVEATPQRAERLLDEYGPALIVELDEELGLS